MSDSLQDPRNKLHLRVLELEYKLADALRYCLLALTRARVQSRMAAMQCTLHTEGPCMHSAASSDTKAGERCTRACRLLCWEQVCSEEEVLYARAFAYLYVCENICACILMHMHVKENWISSQDDACFPP